MILGTISAVDDNNGLQLIVDGEDTATTKKYMYVASYVPAEDDRVLIEEIGGSYVILGKIISEYDSSGIARTANTAQTAQTAETAQTATVSESCTGNAATATTAAACSGNAATATVSDKTKGFDVSVGSEYGSLVTSVSREYDSTLGKYIVTNVSLSSYSRNFVYK